MGMTQRKFIDEQLLLLFTHDYQPFSIVNDYGFRKLIAALNSSYQLPSRKTITNTLLLAAYEQVYTRTKNILDDAKSITLTTDTWTSPSSESFLAVTAHFLNKQFVLKTVLLECISFPESHTSANLATELERILKEWHIEEKIVMVISDNAANIKRAIKDIIKLKHFGCYAHTLNLIAQDALNITHVNEIIAKVSEIVTFFKRSTTCTAKFKEQQIRMNLTPKKLLGNVATRWNSTFYMLERFLELEEPIRTTTAIINKDLPIISLEEWEFLKEIKEILKPLENITVMMSGERYVTASSVIVLTDGLITIYNNFKERQNLRDLSKSVARKIFEGLQSRLGDVENSNSLTASTFLDPRFKNIGFSSTLIAEKVKKNIISLMTAELKDNFLQGQHSTQSLASRVEGEENCAWGNFDKKLRAVVPSGTPQSRAIIEVQRYLEEPPISRKDDAVSWWQHNSYNFPLLSSLVLSKFIPIATSVPCERLFSKSGQILTDRRNRLTSTKVKQLLFVQYNSNL